MKDSKNEQELNRVARIIAFSEDRLPKNDITGKPAKFRKDISVGSRTSDINPRAAWNSADSRGKLLYEEDATRHVSNNTKQTKSQDYIGSYYNWNGPLRPEYDLQDPMAIFDTEAYVKQAINRRLSLMFRNGYEIVGEDKNVAYITQRIATLEFVTDRSFRSLLRDILFCLSLQSNCFLLKIRKDGAAPVRKKDGGKVPVSGYAIIPAHSIQPIMKAGVIDKWRRYYDMGKAFDDYGPDEIIHFKWDRKPWHIYGTPRTVAVRDDIYALRRLEENVEMLFINYLFPLFHVKVGTEDNPATYTAEGISELDLVKYQIENMPKEGVYVSDERTAVEVIGAKSEVLDVEFLINHYKQRVFSGLGMSPLDMGAVDAGTRATSDNISQNLKDLVKADVEIFADQVKMYIFKEWFLEGNYSFSVQDAVEGTDLIFHEIDLDNKIKEENHVLNIYNSNLITFQEARKRLKYKEEADQTQLHMDRDTIRLVIATEEAQVAGAVHLAQVGAELEPSSVTTTNKASTGSSKTIKKTGVGRPQSATAKKSNPVAKTTKNLTAPTNQHGTNLGPTKAKSSNEFLELAKDMLLDEANNYNNRNSDHQSVITWRETSSNIIDSVFKQFASTYVDSSEDYSYTKQLQEELPLLKELIGTTTDLDQLAVLLEYGITDKENTNE